MITVKFVESRFILASDSKGQWYHVNKKDVKVGDKVSPKVCTKCDKSLSEIYQLAYDIEPTIK